MPNRFYKSGSTVWNNANSWSAISSVAIDNAGIPTSGDAVFFDANSGVNCAVTTTVGLCASLTTTGYSGTFLLNVDLAIFGNQVISATTIFNPVGAGFYCPNGTGSITSNGVSFPNFKLNRSSAQFIFTLNDVLNVVNILQDFNGAITNGFSVNVNGNMTIISGISWTGTTIYNLIGTGNFGSIAATPFFGNTININTSGTITFLANVRFSSGTLNYISGNVNTTTNSSLFDLYGNNSVTSKNGANEIVFNNVRAGQASVNGTTTLGSNMRVSGNFTVGNFNGYSFNGNTIFVSGNIINSTTVTNAGTSIMVMEGSSAATISGGIHSRNLTINKSSGAVVTLLGNLTFGQTGGNITINTPLNFTTNNTTVLINGTNLTINNPISNSFFNLTIPAAHVLTLSGASTSILGTLLCSGNANFAGAYGFSCLNFSCTIPASIITFQNIAASPDAEYVVNGALTLIGTSANRITLQSSGFATFNGTITPLNTLNVTSGTAPSLNMTFSQATGFSAALNPANRSIVTSGGPTTFIISPSALSLITPSIAMRAGFKAKFYLSKGTGSQNVIYAATQDIDSSAGQTILVSGSNGDDINNSTIALFRTLNWGPLIAPSGSVHYTFVN